MGIYINPKSGTKEQWLALHAERTSVANALKHTDFETSMPVCLVDNGAFTAAGVAYCHGEVEAFAHPDPRRKQWFIVPIEKLKEVTGVKDFPQRHIRG